MKARGLASPDLGDTLAMTFSVKVAPRPTYVAKVNVNRFGPDGWMLA